MFKFGALGLCKALGRLGFGVLAFRAWVILRRFRVQSLGSKRALHDLLSGPGGLVRR